MNKPRIEVLVFEGCPHLDLALARVHEALAKANAAAELQVVQVENEEQARQLRFLGSPTVRVRGADVELEATERTHYGLQCRVYSVNGHLEGAPSTDWIVSALKVPT